MKKIEVSEQALETIKAMAEKLEKERDWLYGTIKFISEMTEEHASRDPMTAVRVAKDVLEKLEA